MIPEQQVKVGACYLFLSYPMRVTAIHDEWWITFRAPNGSLHGISLSEFASSAELIHEPEMPIQPDDLSALYIDAKAGVLNQNSDWEPTIVSLIDALRAERESRKQAEAALRELDRYLERRSHNYMTELSPIRGMVRAALSKPIPQEPAERESGK